MSSTAYNEIKDLSPAGAFIANKTRMCGKVQGEIKNFLTRGSKKRGGFCLVFCFVLFYFV